MLWLVCERSCDGLLKAGLSESFALQGSMLLIPDTLRFLMILAAIAGAIYGGAFALATFPPEQSEIIKSLPHEKLRQN